MTISSTTKRVLCFGSINIDDVFTVPDIAKPGETISCSDYKMLPGGKGANQSVALAKAGTSVVHGGKIGKDGQWVLDLMKDYGVDTSMVVVDHNAGTNESSLLDVLLSKVSQASHDNTIVLNPGANHQITAQDIDKVLSQFKSRDFVILQNELNSDATLYLLKSCSAKGMVVCLNPAPCPKNLASVLPLELVDILILNESESESLVCQLSTSNVNQKKCNDPATICEIVLTSYPGLSVMVITLGERGLVAGARLHNGAAPTIQSVPITRSVKVQDTTGAGDTFVGFMCGHLISNISLSSDQTHSKTDILTAISAQPNLLEMSLQTGILASGVCCEHSGAMIAIPTKSELMKL
ncbi:hypothetical protein BATDEDRAFT_35435 [Batrachochytrium dendrobatidis JAM81]|uniref:Ribokinase n=1 Tax=Batrachochytrium dendrobatidis (strain JAM81 / FGSC 10211) TaxID=684364 RepID=F4P635_BATDJ|nr:uncharacterized protein BATDEDRAFT_35435 [Batrachochytrium dendrobatidis JAM81]EGF79283.1 hypothetical protein BATDEDRAFT_35435 [Batrachochytrium dendrobatidis JAM81]|eukprot:XP_006679999.1 hypothetical protein BATDEDRAFT_35435 [Batrachochytrium dendrobatidis JAM81]